MLRHCLVLMTTVCIFFFSLSLIRSELIFNEKGKVAWSSWQNQAYQIMYIFAAYSGAVYHLITLSDHISSDYILPNGILFFCCSSLHLIFTKKEKKRGKRLHFLVRISFNVILISNYIGLWIFPESVWNYFLLNLIKIDFNYSHIFISRSSHRNLFDWRT